MHAAHTQVIRPKLLQEAFDNVKAKGWVDPHATSLHAFCATKSSIHSATGNTFVCHVQVGGDGRRVDG